QLVLGDAQVAHRVLSVDVRPEVDDETVAPPKHGGVRHDDLGAAVPSASVQHEEGGGALAEVEVRLGLDVKLVLPWRREVSIPASQSIVAVIDGAADRSEH